MKWLSNSALEVCPVPDKRLLDWGEQEVFWRKKKHWLTIWAKKTTTNKQTNQQQQLDSPDKKKTKTKQNKNKTKQNKTKQKLDPPKSVYRYTGYLYKKKKRKKTTLMPKNK